MLTGSLPDECFDVVVDVAEVMARPDMQDYAKVARLSAKDVYRILGLPRADRFMVRHEEVA